MISNVRRKARHIPTTDSPFALYKLNGVLTDSSGNGQAALTVIAGNATYTEILPGLQGFFFDGSTYLQHAAHQANFVNTGAFSMAMIAMFPDPGTSATQQVCAVMGSTAPGGTSATNGLYSVAYASTRFAQRFSWQQGNNVSVGVNATSEVPAFGRPHLYTWTRDNGGANTSVILYVDDTSIETFTGLAAATGGTDSTVRFTAGASATGTVKVTKGAICSLALFNATLTAAQVTGMYQYCLGDIYGYG